MRTILLLAAIVMLAGCVQPATHPPATPDATPSAAEQAAPAAPCTPANHNNYGTAINGIYVVGAEVWQETNGVTGLQKDRTCEGPADTLVA